MSGDVQAKVQGKVNEVKSEQRGTGDGMGDPIPSHKHAPESSGHGSAEYGGVAGSENPGGGK